MADMMTFPGTWEEFEKSYGFDDSEEVYTNGSRLIPSFRVKQWLDHIAHLESKRQATVSSDCIIRQAAIDAFWKLEVELRPSAIDAVLDMLKNLPSAQAELAQNLHTTCTDAISRQAAIEAIHEDADWLAAQGSDWQVERMERDKSILKSLPSAEPEQLEKCPIYGGVCLHPSDQCYACPRHAGAEPIIRCTNCRFFKRNIPCTGGYYNGCELWLDDGNEIRVMTDDYCSKALPKEGEQDEAE